MLWSCILLLHFYVCYEAAYIYNKGSSAPRTLTICNKAWLEHVQNTLHAMQRQGNFLVEQWVSAIVWFLRETVSSSWKYEKN